MTPWLMLAGFTAATNLLAFVAIRGRWGRIVMALALASVLGTAAGDAVGGRIGIDLVRIGDFHLLAASIGAQAAMIATALLAAMTIAAPADE